LVWGRRREARERKHEGERGVRFCWVLVPTNWNII